METEETQGKILQEDPDLEEGAGEEIQELRTPKPMPPKTQKACQEHRQNTGQQEMQTGTPREEQRSIGIPVHRTQHRLGSVKEEHTRREQGEEVRGASYTGSQWGSEDKLPEDREEEKEYQTGEHANKASGTANSAANRQGRGKSAPSLSRSQRRNK